MAKGWTVLKTVNDVEFTKEEKQKTNKRFSKMVKQAENEKLKDIEKDVERLKKEGEDLFAKRVAEEDAIVAAYNDKRLKSKALIKKAKKIIQNKKKAEKQAAVTPPKQTA